MTYAVATAATRMHMPKREQTRDEIRVVANKIIRRPHVASQNQVANPELKIEGHRPTSDSHLLDGWDGLLQG